MWEIVGCVLTLSAFGLSVAANVVLARRYARLVDRKLFTKVEVMQDDMIDLIKHNKIDGARILGEASGQLSEERPEPPYVVDQSV